MAYRLGKNRVRRSYKTPVLSDYMERVTQWPAVAPRGWEYAVDPSQWGMLGNDTVGDCVIAAMYHHAQCQSANTGQPLIGSTDLALATYSAITGYNPSDPNTDHGTDPLTALQYWQKTGIPMLDASGKEVIHKIIGFASLDISSVAQMRYAADLFGGAMFGIQCPASAMPTPEQPVPNWTYQPNSQIEGGHGIYAAGQGGKGGHVITWGMSVSYSWEFMLNYLDEAYIVIDSAWLDENGKTPSGVDLEALTRAMQSL